jgi:hypothetical protein
MVKITTWADNNTTPDFNSGRWVQIGSANWFTYFLTGLPGGKFYPSSSFPYVRFEKNKSSFSNHKTKMIDASDLEFPRGFGLDGFIKGLLGQRKIK